ncbi:MAG: SemiSWEET family transporter [Wohlfahrtiimonas sp.]
MAEDKRIQILGWVATVTAIVMYVSYIPQIMDNLNGQKGNPIQPLAAAVNCLLWVIYGLKRKDYPIAVANAPGVIFGALAFLTAFI